MEDHDGGRDGEIRFRNSLFRFVLSLGLCLLLGFISNHFIGRYPLETKISENLKLPLDYDLRIHRPRLSFRQGLKPVVALAVARLELKWKSCPMQILTAQDVLVTFSPLALLFGEWKSRGVHVHHLRFDQPQACFSSRILSGPPEEGEVDKNRKQTTVPILSDPPRGEEGRSELSQIPKKDLKKESSMDFWNSGKWDPFFLEKLFRETSKYLKSGERISLKVDELELRWIQDMDRQILLRGSFFAKTGSSIRARWKLHQWQTGEQRISLPSDIKILLEERKLNLKVDMGLREGRAHVELGVLGDASYSTVLHFDMDQLPVSFFNDFLKPRLHYLWLNCKGEISSAWSDFPKTGIQFSHCNFDGPYGEILFPKVETSLSSLDKIEIRINKLELDKIVEDRKAFLLAGVFGSYGILSAHVDYGSKDLQAQGVLENSKIIFSNNRLRDLQSLSRIPFTIKKEKDRWKATIRDVDIEDGEFEGELSFQMDRDFRKFWGNVHISRLLLRPPIYKLMLSSEQTPIRVLADFQWLDGAMGDWSLFFGTSILESEDHRLRDLKVMAEPQQDVPRIKITVKRGWIHPDSKWIRWLDAGTLDKTWGSDGTDFRNFVFHFKLFRDQSFEWQKGSLHLNDGWMLSSRGFRDSGKKIEARFQWFRPDGRSMDWVYRGKLFEGQWQSQTLWVEKWLSNHRDLFKKHNDLQAPAPESGGFRKKINQVGQKAMDRVKKILKPSEKIEKDQGNPKTDSMAAPKKDSLEPSKQEESSKDSSDE